MTNRWHKPARRRACNFSRDNKRVARLRLNPLPDYLLGDTDSFSIRRHWVDLGGIKKINTAIVRGIENLKRLFFVAPTAETHRAHADWRDTKATLADITVFHNVVLIRFYNSLRGCCTLIALITEIATTAAIAGILYLYSKAVGVTKIYFRRPSYYASSIRLPQANPMSQRSGWPLSITRG